jgi:7-cyano-7-deazaguanine reductase
MSSLDSSPLGKPTAYPDRYDRTLLYAIPRAAQRSAMGIHGELPFSGADLWNAYELSWLDMQGKPQIATVAIRIPAESTAMVESKSLKLYLGSFAQENLASSESVAERVESDLAATCGAAITVVFADASNPGSLRNVELPGESIDSSAVAIDAYTPRAELLRSNGPIVEETLRSALFKSNCPVTGQPDYADVLVRYRGPRIDRESLLRYLVSYRRHAAFHEACVEEMFMDIAERCRSDRLTVYARFLRRGGIDINPFRSNFERPPEQDFRTPRQ